MSKASDAFRVLARTASEFEMHLDGDAVTIITANVERLRAAVESKPDGTYPILKQVMNDVAGLSLTGRAAETGQAFVLAYAQLLDAL